MKTEFVCLHMRLENYLLFKTTFCVIIIVIIVATSKGKSTVVLPVIVGAEIGLIKTLSDRISLI